MDWTKQKINSPMGEARLSILGAIVNSTTWPIHSFIVRESSNSFVCGGSFCNIQQANKVARIRLLYAYIGDSYKNERIACGYKCVLGDWFSISFTWAYVNGLRVWMYDRQIKRHMITQKRRVRGQKETCMWPKRPIDMYDQRVYNTWVGRREGCIIYI